MDAWIDFAMGPLFRISLAVCLLGLAYRFVVAASSAAAAWVRAGDKDLPWRAVGTATLQWVFPAGLLRSRPLYSAASFLFHVGIIGLPLFLAGHVALLEQSYWLARVWPTLPPLLADALSVSTIVLCAGLVWGRLASPMSRALSRASDVLIVLLLLGVVLAGFLAAHPTLVPVSARALLLVHLLLGNLALVLTPVTKIAHCVLFPLLQLTFQLGWHFPAATGEHVAIALGKENEPV
jgi:nitrate reductase gamma subunit